MSRNTDEGETELCVICQDTVSVEDRLRLDCGHTFHPHCAVQWFRYNNCECPLCRSSSVMHAWTRPSAAQRIRGMRTRFTRLDPTLRRKVRQYDQWVSRLRERRAELTALKRSHADVLRRYHAATAKVYHARRQLRGLATLLTSVAAPGVPLLHVGEDPSDDAIDDNTDEFVF